MSAQPFSPARLARTGLLVLVNVFVCTGMAHGQWTPKRVTQGDAPTEKQLIADFHDAFKGNDPERLALAITTLSEGSRRLENGGSGKVITTVHFTILRDGTILDPEVVTPSGWSLYDRVALSAVHSTRKLPPLPEAYSGDELGLTVHFQRVGDDR